MSASGHIVCKNVFESTRQYHQQAFQRILSGATKKKEILLFAFTAVLFLLAVVPGIRSGARPVFQGSELLFWCTVVLFVLLLLLFYIVPYIFSVITINAQNKSSGGQTVRIETTFEDDRIAVRNCLSDTTTEIPYNAVIRCAETDDLLLLQTTARSIVILSKNGFEGCGDDEFRAFIAGKCPQARMMWRRRKIR